MFCANCGSQLPDESKFCTNCGAQVDAPAAPAAAQPQQPTQAQPQQQAWQQPQGQPQQQQAWQQPQAQPPAQPPKGGLSRGAIIGIAVAVVAIIVVAVIAFGGMGKTSGTSSSADTASSASTTASSASTGTSSASASSTSTDSSSSASSTSSSGSPATGKLIEYKNDKQGYSFMVDSGYTVTNDGMIDTVYTGSKSGTVPYFTVTQFTKTQGWNYETWLNELATKVVQQQGDKLVLEPTNNKVSLPGGMTVYGFEYAYKAGNGSDAIAAMSYVWEGDDKNFYSFGATYYVGDTETPAALQEAMSTLMIKTA